MTTAQPTNSGGAGPASPGETPAGRQGLGVVAIVLLFVLYTIFLATHIGAYAGGSDTAGYLNLARLFGQGVTATNQRTIPEADRAKLPGDAFIPLGFRASGKDRMVPVYSTGLPLVVTGVATVTGWSAAPHVTMIFFSLCGILVTAWLARVWGLPGGWAWAAALLVAGCPLYLMYSLMLMSDVPALALCCGAVVTAWKSRGRAVWALAAGFLLAAAVLTRPTNILMFAVVALCLGFSWRNWLMLGLGGLPGAVFLYLYNRANYGHVTETGYGSIGWLFSADYVVPTLLLYVKWIPFFLTPVVLLALGIPFVIRRDPWRLAALVTWILCIFGFYAFYFCTHESAQFLRFVLPAFPPLVVGSLVVLRALLQSSRLERLRTRFGRHSCALVALLIAVGCVFCIQQNIRFKSWQAGKFESVYIKFCTWANQTLPPNSVICSLQSSGAIYCYTGNIVVRPDQLNAAQESEIQRACTASGRPLYALLLPSEEEQFLKNHFLDGWTKVAAPDFVNCWRFETSKGTDKIQ